MIETRNRWNEGPSSADDLEWRQSLYAMQMVEVYVLMGGWIVAQGGDGL